MNLAASVTEHGFPRGWWVAYIEVCIFLFGWGVILKKRIVIKMKRMEEKGVQGLPISGSKPPDSQASRQLSSYLREGKFRETEDASFNGSLRDECLDRELMLSLAEARVLIEDYRVHYNDERPHGGIGYRTPAQARMEAEALVSSRPTGSLCQELEDTPALAILDA